MRGHREMLWPEDVELESGKEVRSIQQGDFGPWQHIVSVESAKIMKSSHPAHLTTMESNSFAH